MLSHVIQSYFFVIKCHRTIVLLCCALLVNACATTNDKAVVENITPDIFHQDSTVYFFNKKASVSLRASFIQETSKPNNTVSNSVTTQSLTHGYKLQFRSILKGNNTVEHISIIAGGKKFILQEKALFIQPNKGLTINASQADTDFIMAQRDATLRFQFNQQSYLMSIRNHTLSEFIIPN